MVLPKMHFRPAMICLRCTAGQDLLGIGSIERLNKICLDKSFMIMYC